MDSKNGLTSRMSFSELYKIMVNKVTFVGFSAGSQWHGLLKTLEIS